MDEVLTRAAAGPPEGVAYPRPGPCRSDRLADLYNAHYGMSVAFMLIVFLAACLILLLGLSYGSPWDIFNRLERSNYLTWGFCLLPFVAGALCYLPLRSLARGASWRPWTAAALSCAIPIYMIAVYFIYPARSHTWSDVPPIEIVWEQIWITAFAILIFPALRCRIAVQLQRNGLPLRYLLLGRKRVREEIERIKMAELSEPFPDFRPSEANGRDIKRSKNPETEKRLGQ